MAHFSKQGKHTSDGALAHCRPARAIAPTPLVPDRSDDCGHVDGARALLDALLSLFPLRPAHFALRERTGRFPHDPVIRGRRGDAQ